MSKNQVYGCFENTTAYNKIIRTKYTLIHSKTWNTLTTKPIYVCVIANGCMHYDMIMMRYGY